MFTKEQAHYWLLKTEPNCWSWQNQAANSGLSVWDGVRNLQAQKFMKCMNDGDLCFFYHTGKLKEVAGIVRVVKTFYPDPTDDSGRWGAVDVQQVRAFKNPVTLVQMREDEHFKGFQMLRQPRLSVVPVEESIWDRVCELGEAEISGLEESNASKGTKEIAPSRRGVKSSKKGKRGAETFDEIKQAKDGKSKKEHKQVDEEQKKATVIGSMKSPKGNVANREGETDGWRKNVTPIGRSRTRGETKPVILEVKAVASSNSGNQESRRCSEANEALACTQGQPKRNRKAS